MEYRALGRTGVQVSPLCLGTMMFGPWGNDDEADVIRIVHAAFDAGINFVDTADIYSDGRSEELTGKKTCCRPCSAMAWGRSPTVPWAAGGCRGAGGRMPRERPPRRVLSTDSI